MTPKHNFSLSKRAFINLLKRYNAYDKFIINRKEKPESYFDSFYKRNIDSIGIKDLISCAFCWTQDINLWITIDSQWRKTKINVLFEE